VYPVQSEDDSEHRTKSRQAPPTGPSLCGTGAKSQDSSSRGRHTTMPTMCVFSPKLRAVWWRWWGRTPKFFRVAEGHSSAAGQQVPADTDFTAVCRLQAGGPPAGWLSEGKLKLFNSGDPRSAVLSGEEYSISAPITYSTGFVAGSTVFNI
jgi:hypothetical protein